MRFGLLRLEILLAAVTLWAVAAGPGAAFAERTPGPYDEEHPLSFVGTQPAVLDGRPIDVIGIAPTYVRVVYKRKKMSVPNREFDSLTLDGANWDYDPDVMSFEDLVAKIAATPGYTEMYGAVGNTPDVREALTGSADPVGDETSAADDADNTGRAELPPPPSVKRPPVPSVKRPSSAGPPSPKSPVEQPTQPAAAEPGGFDLKNVPDWVKYLSAAAVVIVLVKFFRD